MSLVLGIDLGTSGCRSAVFDDRLNMLCSARTEYPLSIPGGSRIEQDAGVWWDSVRQTVREATALLGKKSAAIRSIGRELSGHIHRTRWERRKGAVRGNQLA